jgi:hypothetical protein
MAVIQPSSFAQLMQRAPVLADQGGGFGAITSLNAGLAARIAGDTMAAKADQERLRIQGETLLAIEKERRKPAQSSLGDRLRAITPALLTMGQSGGIFGGGGRQRLAGEMLSSVLGSATVTPSQLLDEYNNVVNGLNVARGQIEPWSATSRQAARGGISLQ